MTEAGNSELRKCLVVDKHIVFPESIDLSALARHDYRTLDTLVGDAVIVALPSPLCLTFCRSSAEMKALRTKSLVKYDLEDELPLDVDLLALARIDCPGETLVVATDSSQLIPVIEGLRERGKFIACICPEPMLLIGELKSTNKLAKTQLILIQSELGVDVIRISGGRPSEWEWVDADVDSVCACIKRFEGRGHEFREVLAINFAEEFIARLKSQMLNSRVESVAEISMVAEAKRLIEGRSKPICDLRSGPLSVEATFHTTLKPLVFFCVALLIFELSLVGGYCFRGSQYQLRAADSFERQEAAFAKVFPEMEVPVGIVSRLESERRRVIGQKGLGESSTPQVKSLLPVIQSFLEAIPPQFEDECRVSQIHLSSQGIELLIGNATTIADQEKVVSALRNAGFDIPKLSAEKTASGVALRIENAPFVSQKF
ncbi:hypothetical protein [Roseiconus lacunae]|uniref:hypothetical protein n=1 Tax=Roseiconus lacunae TaxID=2605694 RepID=UPI001E3A1338|nr:hypothetical protein [Roseiconus lacunae]MCD0462267.1 hypothetical protein [Roseiconus lacunae]